MLSEKEFNRLRGSQLLDELHLYAGHQMRIDVEELGFAINHHQRVVITIELVDGKKSWVLRDATDDVLKKAWGHGYLVEGERYHKIGGSIARAKKVLKNFKPLKRGESEKRKKEAEDSLKHAEVKGSSGLFSKIPWLNRARRKMEAEKKLAEKVDKGILPKAKIIYTPMGNDRRRKK